MSDKRNVSDITLDMSYGGSGALLKEVVRAHLHNANPSAILGRILEGARAYREQVSDATDKENSILLVEFINRLHFMHQEVLRREQQMLSDIAASVGMGRPQ